MEETLPPTNDEPSVDAPTAPARGGIADKLLYVIEKVGNWLPDPAVLFVIALAATWAISKAYGGLEFKVPAVGGEETRVITDQLTWAAFAQFLSGMVKTFTGFHPLGVVLVALLGVGVAEHSGFINAMLKALLRITPKTLLTPMLILVAVVSHTATDAGYVLVIPLGAVIFMAAGRHPLAGIAAAFAGVSGGFGANFVPSGIDPLLQGLTQSAAGILDPAREVNPLCNWWFTSASSALVVGVGWLLTDKFVEPRLNRGTKVDGDPADMPTMGALEGRETFGMIMGLLTMVGGLVGLYLLLAPEDSAFRDPNKTGWESITSFGAPVMQSIVPLIFILFLLPGIVHGYAAGTFKSHRDVIQAMSKSMSTMGYYLVMAFCASLFIESFKQAQLGAFLAVKGAEFLQELAMPGQATVIGIILICTMVNLLVGSASAKWALLAPIFVPMLMTLGISPELTQAAYRVGDSTTNIITPLMPYFPLVVAFGQRYVKGTGVGTIAAMMLPYTIVFLVLWIGLLMIFWGLGIPLGIQGTYDYVMGG